MYSGQSIYDSSEWCASASLVSRSSSCSHSCNRRPWLMDSSLSSNFSQNILSRVTNVMMMRMVLVMTRVTIFIY